MPHHALRGSKNPTNTHIRLEALPGRMKEPICVYGDTVLMVLTGVTPDMLGGERIDAAFCA